MDLERIESLLDLLAEHEVTEFKYKDEDITLRLRLGPEPAPVAAPAPAPAVAAGPTPAPAPQRAAPAEAVETESADDSLVDIESPMVGTFYRSSEPDAEPFVEVGDRVSRGQTLCIVEAMKLMNEIEAELSGTLVEILVDDAEPVQFGQAMFRIRPD